MAVRCLILAAVPMQRVRGVSEETAELKDRAAEAV